MKKTQHFLYLLLTAGILLLGAPIIAQTVVPFSYTGSLQTWTVPAGVTSITIDAGGAQGGGDATNTTHAFGGRVQATYTVTPGATLNIYVGGAGGDGSTSTATPASGGYNGGGTAGWYSTIPPGYSGGGGGGATDIRIGGTGLGNRVLVAGGGGGGGYTTSPQAGGAGGGTTGASGNTASGINPATGGTPSAGGNGGTFGGQPNGGNGSLGTGGNASIGNGVPGGGRGGYYGGGGGGTTGAGPGGGGGGGSSYTDPSMTSVTHTQGYNSGNGYVNISYAPPGGTLAFINGSPQSMPATCENTSAMSINSLLTTSDNTAGETLTWTVSSGPTHGTLGGFSTTATSIIGNSTPTGLTYTPTSGYSGTDAFTIQVSNGINSVTTTINVTVNPSPTITLATIPAVCQGATSATLSYSNPIVFNYTGGAQTWTVPSGVTGLTFDVDGASGGFRYGGTGNPGKGGRVTGSLTVTPGQTLNVYVGGSGATGSSTGATGGYNGGGQSYNYGGGGGGASDIRIGGTALTDRKIIAGGGGGGGADGASINGGDGGGLIGANGGPNPNPGTSPAGGGTQSAGGAGANYPGWGTGSAGVLGAGGAGLNSPGSTYSAGGGAGYYGGGGGVWSGGGGGSSYTDPGLASAVTHTQGYNDGNGYVVITPLYTVYTYSINWSSAAISAGFNNVTNDTITTTSINISVPATAPTAVYSGTVTVSNGTCNSVAAPITVTVNPVPNVNATADMAICNNAATTAVVFTGSVTPTTYTWTNDNSSIGLASTGTGNIASFTAMNVTSVTDTANIIVTPSAGGCTGMPDTFRTIVYPTPNVIPTGDQTECNGTMTAAVSFSGAVSGTVYTWTNNNSTVGLASTGTGNIASFSATNITSVTDTATVIVTPTANGCAGPTDTFMITVYPTPNIVPIPNQAKCNGAPTDSIGFSGSVSGTTYTWTNDNTSIGLASSGTGNISSFTATNTTTATDSGTIMVMTSANGCSGAMDTFVITVYPTPMLTSTLTPPAICDSTMFIYGPTSLTAGTTYAWSRASIPTISNLMGAGTDSVHETLVNIITNQVPVTYVYTLTANGCANVQNVVVTVNPYPKLSSALTNQICDSLLFQYAPTSATGDSSFTWVRPYVAGIDILPGSGSGAINDTLINTTNFNVVDTYYYTISAFGCSYTEPMTVTVHPTPTFAIGSAGPFAVCSGLPFDYTPTSITPTTTYTWIRPSVTGVGSSTATGTGAVSETLTDSLTTPQHITYFYTLSAYGCTHNENVLLTLNPKPEAVQITTAVTNVCDSTLYQNFGATSPAPGYESYAWSATGATIVSGSMGQYSLVDFTTPGSATVTLTVTIDSTGCSNTYSDVVTVGASTGEQPTVIYSFGEFICLQNDVSSYQWGYDNKVTLDSTILIGQVNQSYANSNPDTVHNYYWVMTDKSGCMKKAYYNAPSTTGVSSANNDFTDVKIYPNPTSDYINVDINTTMGGNVTVELTNMLGQKITAVPAMNNKAAMDVSKLASGVYIVDCYRDGVKIAAAKFIKN